MNDQRLDNLLGALALAVMDRLTLSIAQNSGLQGSSAYALVLLGQTPGLSIDALAKILGRAHSSTVRLIEQLVESGLLSRQAGKDRRQVLVSLTIKGQDAVDKVLSARQNALAQMTAVLPSASAQILTDAFERLLEHLSDDATSASRNCRLCNENTCGQSTCPVEIAYLRHTADR